MKVTNQLDRDELDRLIDLTEGYADSVRHGDISGFGQSKGQELAEVDALTAKLKAMRDL